MSSALYWLGILMLVLANSIESMSLDYNMSNMEGTSGEELKALMVDSVENLSSYRFLTKSVEEWNILDNQLNKSNLTNIFIEEGEINLTSQSLNLTQREDSIPDSRAITSSRAMVYIFNGLIYIMTDNKWNGLELSKSEIFLNNMNLAMNQTDLLKNSTIKLLGFEKIDGQECYWLQVEPNRETYATLLSELLDQKGISTNNINWAMKDASSSFGTGIVYNVSKLCERGTIEWTSWITKDTHLLKKNEIIMRLTLNPDSIISPTNKKLEGHLNITTNIIYRDFNQTVSITPSDDWRSAFPFPIRISNQSINATVFGIIRDPKDTDIYIDVVSSSPIKANLIDIDDRFYPVEDSRLDANIRGFLHFEIPQGTIIKRIRFESGLGHYGTEKEFLPFSLDLRLDRLGSVIRIPEEKEETRAVAGEIDIILYDLKRGTTYSNQAAILILDIKIKNNDTIELPLNLADFSLIDQYGWEYAADASNLGILLPGESRRFGVKFEGVSDLSKPTFLKYRNMKLNL